MERKHEFWAKSKYVKNGKKKKMKTKILPKPQDVKIYPNVNKKMFSEQNSSCQKPNPTENHAFGERPC